MSILSRKLMGTTNGGILVDDVFSTDLYTGNGSTQTITNGLDLAGEGGLGWIKGRSGATDNQLFDTVRGATKELISNSAALEATDADTLTAFNSDGFSIGADSNVNTNTATYAAWTFRKFPRFFDVVTYTGNGATARAIPHNLGVAPGMIWVKATGLGQVWPVYHKDLGSNSTLTLNQQGAEVADGSNWNAGLMSDTHFGINTNFALNSGGSNYVAYLFAHDTEASGFMQCGVYTGNGSVTGPVVSLGWEPQWLLVKAKSRTGGWYLYDNKRSPTNPRTRWLDPSYSSAEGTSGRDFDFLENGFQPKTSFFEVNNSGDTYIYMAIRKEDA